MTDFTPGTPRAIYNTGKEHFVHAVDGLGLGADAVARGAGGGVGGLTKMTAVAG